MSSEEGALKERAALLRKAELFAGLLDDDLAYAASRCGQVSRAPGTAIFDTGDPARSFWIVRSGVVVLRRLARGEEREMARYLPGDVFGDFEFAVDGRRGDRARAEGPVELLEFPAAGLSMADLARERPDATARILLRSLGMISSRLRATQNLISENAPWVRELRRQIYTDPGTGLWSRAFLETELPAVLEAPTGIVLLKPDRFKDLVDGAGHAAGELGGLLAAEAGHDDGGLVAPEPEGPAPAHAPHLLLEELGDGGHRLVARRLARSIRVLDSPAARSAGLGYSFSASVAVASWPGDSATWRRLVEDAEGVMTRAWSDGGDRVYRLKPRADAGAPPDGRERRGSAEGTRADDGERPAGGSP